MSAPYFLAKEVVVAIAYKKILATSQSLVGESTQEVMIVYWEGEVASK